MHASLSFANCLCTECNERWRRCILGCDDQDQASSSTAFSKLLRTKWFTIFSPGQVPLECLYVCVCVCVCLGNRFQKQWSARTLYHADSMHHHEHIMTCTGKTIFPGDKLSTTFLSLCCPCAIHVTPAHNIHAIPAPLAHTHKVWLRRDGGRGSTGEQIELIILKARRG